MGGKGFIPSHEILGFGDRHSDILLTQDEFLHEGVLHALSKVLEASQDGGIDGRHITLSVCVTQHIDVKAKHWESIAKCAQAHDGVDELRCIIGCVPKPRAELVLTKTVFHAQQHVFEIQGCQDTHTIWCLRLVTFLANFLHPLTALVVQIFQLPWHGKLGVFGNFAHVSQHQGPFHLGHDVHHEDAFQAIPAHQLRQWMAEVRIQI
mmetsp:Transcript_39232/g.98683  ORF Transcript_39232/g.98683 Transcript_39232/m.98683 type:complete len:207 (+) Transcript_39232:1493-2113(+)